MKVAGGKEGGRFFYIYIHLWTIKLRRKKIVGMELVVFVIIHTTSVEYNSKSNSPLHWGKLCMKNKKLLGFYYYYVVGLVCVVLFAVGFSLLLPGGPCRQTPSPGS